MSRTERELLADALDHIRTLHRHLERNDLADETVVDAVSLRLAAAIESLALLSPDTRDRVARGQWNLMWATRNRIAHGYSHIDLAVIHATVDRDLPVLKADIEAVLASWPHL